jgi:hypothetical protein
MLITPFLNVQEYIIPLGTYSPAKFKIPAFEKLPAKISDCPVQLGLGFMHSAFFPPHLSFAQP